MSKKTLVAAVAALSTAAFAVPALAGNLNPPVQEPVVTAPPAPAPMVMTPNWTGAYVGAEAGYDHASAADSGNSGVGGVFAGYNYDFGKFVLGGEIGYDKMNAGTGGGSKLKSTTTAKIRAGYDFGKTLGYVALGAQHANGKIDGSGINGTGTLVGIGADYMVTDHMVVGGEADFTRYGNANDNGTDLKNTTVQARVSFKF